MFSSQVMTLNNRRYVVAGARTLKRRATVAHSPLVRPARQLAQAGVAPA